MADTFTPRIRLRQPEPGQHVDAWGPLINEDFIELLEDAICGVATIDVTAGNHTLTVDDGQPDEDRNLILHVTGTPGTPRTITCFGFGYKLYLVANDSDSAVTLTNGTSGIAVLPGQRAPLHGNLLGADGIRRFAVSTDLIPQGVRVTQTVNILNTSGGDTTTDIHYMIQGQHLLVTIEGHTSTFTNSTWSYQRPTGLLSPNGGLQAVRSTLVDTGGVLREASMRVDGSGNIAFNRDDAVGWGVGSRSLPMNLTFAVLL